MITKNQLSLAGEFAVLSQLLLHGFDANLTLGNTKEVDILVLDPETNNMRKLEVKTAPERVAKEKHYGDGRFYFWIMSQKHEELKDPNLFYCFVVNADDRMRYFIVPSSVVADYVKKQHDLWISARKSQVQLSPMRKFRIGLDGQELYNMDTPLFGKYENNWEMLRSARQVT